MPERVQVADLREPVPLQPQATPVDRFAPKSDLSKQRLGLALQNLGSTLGQAGQRVAKTMAENELKELQPQARLLTRDFNRYLVSQYAQSDAKSSEDPSVQAKFLADTEGKFFSEVRPGVNPKVLKIARPGIEGSLDNISNRLAEDAVRARYDRIESDVSAEVSQIVSIRHALSPEEETQQLAAAFSDSVSLGLSADRARSAVAKSWLSAAEERKDTEMLSRLEDFKLPNGARLVDPAIKAQIENSRQNIASQIIRDENQEWTRYERSRTLDSRTIFNEGLRRLVSDPDADLTDLAVIAERAGVSDAFGPLVTMKSQMIGEKERIDFDATRELWAQIYMDKDVRNPAVLANLAGRFRIDPRTLQEMLQTATRLDTSKHRDVFETNPIIKNSLAALRKATVKGSALMGTLDSSSVIKGLDAEITYRRAIDGWLAANPDSSEADLIKFSRGLVSDIVGGYALLESNEERGSRDSVFERMTKNPAYKQFLRLLDEQSGSDANPYTADPEDMFEVDDETGLRPQ